MTRGAAILLVVACSCGREANAPPGAEGRLDGVWVGTLEREGTSYAVALWLEEDGATLTGVGAQLEGAPASLRISAPEEAPCEELERSESGTITHRIATDLGADVDFAVSLDGQTHQLIGQWAADTDLTDEGGDLVLTRTAWLPTREQGVDGTLLGCVERTVPACADGLDNDDDGLTDIDDPACCAGQSFGCAPVGTREDADPPCDDGLDNDGDGAADGDDPECPTSPEIGDEPACADGWDNDGDGAIDTDDDACASPRGSAEVAPVDFDPEVPGCSNGGDDDGDGSIDLADPSCHGQANRPEYPSDSTCDDGVDNDGDGATDVDEPECTRWYPLGKDSFWLGVGDEVPDVPFPFPSRGPGACVDDSDNDGDGRVDFADPDCTVSDPLAGGDLFEDLPACLDLVDDDGDGLVDAADPDCASLHGVEVPTALPRVQCEDGEDNDGDGLVDAADPHCFAPFDWTEAAACSDGRDDDGDAWFDLADPGCVDADDDSELP